MKKLGELSKKDGAKPVDIEQVQAIVFEQLNGLAEKFSRLSKEDVDDYTEMKIKIAGIIEEFCIMDNVNKLVR